MSLPSDQRRVLTITPNPALDVTYRLDDLVVGTEHRVAEVVRRPGGKGVNVARVLHQLGVCVTTGGLLGGATGERIEAALRTEGVANEFLRMRHRESRQTVAVVDGSGTATLLSETGPEITASEWRRLTRWTARRARSHAVVVLSGSLPRGAPGDGYAELVSAAKRAGARTILDTSGEWLRRGVEAGPDLVKPNRFEALQVTGLDDHASAAAALRQAGASAVAVSLGVDGVYLDAEGGPWLAPAHTVAVANPTGAGDAAVAGLALGLLEGADAPRLAVLAMAAGTAATRCSAAGELDMTTFSTLRESASRTTHSGSEEVRRPWG